MSESPPNVQAPTPEEIRAYADKHHIKLSDAEVEDFEVVIDGATVLSSAQAFDAGRE